MIQRWFVTGTDTDVGKTVASSALLLAAGRAGYRTAGYKPVASGCTLTPEGLRNPDALMLQKCSVVPLNYHEVNPLAFAEPTSPHIISASEGRPITFAAMSAGLSELAKKADWLLTEGAGGWYTPLSDKTTFAEWVTAEQLPVILVVGMRLGCINHAMLTVDAIDKAGVPLGGWIANDVQPPGARHQAYLATLQQCLPAPFLGEIPHITTPQGWCSLADTVNLPTAVASV